MSHKWGHPVATLPVTNGTIRHIRRMTEILRITARRPAPTRAPPLALLGLAITWLTLRRPRCCSWKPGLSQRPKLRAVPGGPKKRPVQVVEV
eukprot:3015909-Pleurochrysis_carterae.AAC.1